MADRGRRYPSFRLGRNAFVGGPLQVRSVS